MRNMTKRDFLGGASAACTLSTPIIFASPAEANPVLIFQRILSDSFKSALVSMGRRRIVSAATRRGFQEQVSEARNIRFSRLLDEFEGQFTRALFRESLEELVAIAGTAVNDDPSRYGNALALGLMRPNVEFQRARNRHNRQYRSAFSSDLGLCTTDGRRVPGKAIAVGANISLIEIEVIALRYAVSQRRSEGWSSDRIARCFTPIGVGDTDVPIANNPYYRARCDCNVDLQPHYSVQTPTGYFSVEGRIDRGNGRIEFQIVARNKPDFQICHPCDPENDCIIETRDQFSGSLHDFG